MRWHVIVFYATTRDEFDVWEPTELEAEIHAEELCRSLGAISFCVELA